MQEKVSPVSVDIFCRVIDNYGDAGVMWRLARALVNLNYRVRLIIDEPATLRSLAGCSQSTPTEEIGKKENITVCLWKKEWDEGACALDPAQVVIEGFACRLPADYQRKMTEQPPKWFNIDYFSAEDWIEGCHLRPSIDPSTGLVKINYFPGVTEKSGSLTFEKDYEALEAKWLHEHPKTTRALRVLFFAYPYGPINEIAQAITALDTEVELALTRCEAAQLLEEALNRTHNSKLTFKHQPFVAQKDFDPLLWDSDIVFIRGEDSAARAMLSGVPFIWHIYRQDDDVHLIKLKALQERLKPYFEDESVFNTWCSVQEALNRKTFPTEDFRKLIEHYSQWKEASAGFARHLQSLGSLSEKLSDLIKNG